MPPQVKKKWVVRQTGVLGSAGESSARVRGAGASDGEGAAADGGGFEGEEFEGGAAVVVEALAEAGVFDSEGFVFLFEGEDAVLGLEDEVADGALIVAAEGALDFHQLIHESGGIHGARSW